MIKLCSPNKTIAFFMLATALSLLACNKSLSKKNTFEERTLSAQTTGGIYRQLVKNSDLTIEYERSGSRDETYAIARGEISNNFNFPFFLEKEGWILIKELNEDGGKNKIYCKNFAQFDLLVGVPKPNSFAFEVRSESC